MSISIRVGKKILAESKSIQNWSNSVKGSDLSWNNQITLADKADAGKLGFLFNSRRYFMPTQLISLYTAPQIPTCLEFSPHI